MFNHGELILHWHRVTSANRDKLEQTHQNYKKQTINRFKSDIVEQKNCKDNTATYYW